MRIISQYRNNQLFEVVRAFYNNGELIPGAQYCDQECLQVHTACGHAFHCRWRFQRSMRALVTRDLHIHARNAGNAYGKAHMTLRGLTCPNPGVNAYSCRTVSSWKRKNTKIIWTSARKH